MKFLRLWTTIFALILVAFLGGVLLVVPGVLMVLFLSPILASVCGLIYVMGLFSALFAVIEYDNWN